LKEFLVDLSDIMDWLQPSVDLGRVAAEYIRCGPGLHFKTNDGNWWYGCVDSFVEGFYAPKLRLTSGQEIPLNMIHSKESCRLYLSRVDVDNNGSSVSVAINSVLLVMWRGLDSDLDSEWKCFRFLGLACEESPPVVLLQDMESHIGNIQRIQMTHVQFRLSDVNGPLLRDYQ
jgi:hypothetical protein